MPVICPNNETQTLRIGPLNARNTKLPAISIRQPWAWLIVNGYKDIENRTWRTKVRGQVLIHAGQSKADTTTEALAYIKRRYRIADLPDKFETGGIVGIADITGVVKRHRSKWFHSPYGFGMNWPPAVRR